MLSSDETWPEQTHLSMFYHVFNHCYSLQVKVLRRYQLYLSIPYRWGNKRSTTSSNCRGLNGLVRYSLQPICNAASFSSFSAYAVTATIGTFTSAGRDRINCVVR